MRLFRGLRKAGAALGLACACVACGAAPAPASPSPSPTIAAAPAAPALSPTVAAAATPAVVPATSPAATAPAEPSIYLWPSYLPEGMQPAPQESRVSGESELGEGDIGFYLITLNGGGKKLAIGGGGLRDALPLTGDTRAITSGGRAGKLISNGEQREIVFEVPRGTLFVYSLGLSEDELLRVAGSLQPIDVRALRALAAPK